MPPTWAFCLANLDKRINHELMTLVPNRACRRVECHRARDCLKVAEANLDNHALGLHVLRAQTRYDLLRLVEEIRLDLGDRAQVLAERLLVTDACRRALGRNRSVVGAERQLLPMRAALATPLRARRRWHAARFRRCRSQNVSAATEPRPTYARWASAPAVRRVRSSRSLCPEWVPHVRLGSMDHALEWVRRLRLAHETANSLLTLQTMCVHDSPQSESELAIRLRSAPPMPPQQRSIHEGQRVWIGGFGIQPT